MGTKKKYKIIRKEFRKIAKTTAATKFETNMSYARRSIRLWQAVAVASWIMTLVLWVVNYGK